MENTRPRPRPRRLQNHVGGDIHHPLLQSQQHLLKSLLFIALLICFLTSHVASGGVPPPNLSDDKLFFNDGTLPPFIHHKVSEALESQPIPTTASPASSSLPSLTHYIHATLESRNNRHYKRHDEAYDAHALISEDTLAATMHNEKLHHEYTYENGRLLHNDMCVEHETSIAPMVHFSQFAQKLTDLRKSLLIDHESFDKVTTFDSDLNKECANLQMYGIVYSDTHFVLCADDQELRHVVSESLWIEIKEWSVDSARIAERRHEMDLKPHKLKTCPFPTGLTLFSPRTLQAFEEHKESEPWYQRGSVMCKLPFIRDMNICVQNDHNPIPEEEQRDCVFLHGVGEWITGNLTDSFPDYWGYVEDYTPQCKTRTFIHQETKMRGWDNDELQEKYCEAALVGNAPGDRQIHDKVLFVHSMGNLILAGAIKSEKCSINSDSTSWFNIMGPMYGSKAAIMLQDICNQVNDGIANKIYRFIALEGGYCMPNTNSSYPAYMTLSPSYKGVSELMSVAQNYISGSMCGDSATGLLSRYSVLKALSYVVGYDHPNDGMVPIPSCSVPGAEYIVDYKNAWYRADVNHADGTCRSGNGWVFGASKQPCSYFNEKGLIQKDRKL